MSYQNIVFSLDAGIARVTLNRPDRLNSFNGEMHLELRDALAQTIAGRARVLLLTGAGRGFCAGQDLSDRNVAAGAEPVDLGYTIETFYKPLILSLRALEMPVICAVNGVAAGAGASIALAATSCSPRARPASSRPSARSDWYPTPAVPGYCRAWSARPAPWGWRCWATSFPPNRPSPGA